MGPGVVLVVIGAILAFAVRDEVPAVDIHTVGFILMIAGAVVIAHAHRNEQHERVVTRTESDGDPELPTHVTRETTVERDVR
jgi:hypothetical protein